MCSPKSPEQDLGPASFLLNLYRVLFLRGLNVRNEKLTTHLNLVSNYKLVKLHTILIAATMQARLLSSGA